MYVCGCGCDQLCGHAMLIFIDVHSVLYTCMQVFIFNCMCSRVHTHAYKCVYAVVFKACCHGVKQKDKSLLTDQPPAGESPTERQRGGDETNVETRGQRTGESKGDKKRKKKKRKRVFLIHKLRNTFLSYMVQWQCHSLASRQVFNVINMKWDH